MLPMPREFGIQLRPAHSEHISSCCELASGMPRDMTAASGAAAALLLLHLVMVPGRLLHAVCATNNKLHNSSHHSLGCSTHRPAFTIVHKLGRLANIFPDLVDVPLFELASQQLLMPFTCFTVTSHLALARSTHAVCPGSVRPRAAMEQVRLLD